MPENLGVMLEHFLLSFIPIFVAIDIPGTLPIYLGLVSEKNAQEKRTIAYQATVTAFVVGVGFVLVGNAIFRIMGITLQDFRIAGGILLFILATAELVGDSEHRKPLPGTVGIFPIGIPLIIGPAALATLLMQHEAHGLLVTICALVANMLIVWVCLYYADLMNRLLGQDGSRAFAKIANLLLASIGVMMVRCGLEDLGLVIRKK
ncbi:MAG: MarC family protein [Candidatus Riflebacteria bacterium]|nr:MarC family protein [Candidatus Riflebacteria bacterium]